jgi:hypothetical protein
VGEQAVGRRAHLGPGRLPSGSDVGRLAVRHGPGGRLRRGAQLIARRARAGSTRDRVHTMRSRHHGPQRRPVRWSLGVYAAVPQVDAARRGVPTSASAAAFRRWQPRRRRGGPSVGSAGRRLVGSCPAGQASASPTGLDSPGRHHRAPDGFSVLAGTRCLRRRVRDTIAVSPESVARTVQYGQMVLGTSSTTSPVPGRPGRW